MSDLAGNAVTGSTPPTTGSFTADTAVPTLDLNTLSAGSANSGTAINGALQFNGNNGAQAAGTVTLANQLTLEMWFNYSALTGNWNRMLDINNVNTGYDRSINVTRHLTSNQLNLSMFGLDWTFGSSNEIALNTWKHLAITGDGTNLIAYINGEEVARTAWGARPSNTRTFDQVAIGAYLNGISANANMTGQLADVRIYNSARTQEQIVKDMQGVLDSTDASLLVQYGFNNATGFALSLIHI